MFKALLFLVFVINLSLSAELKAQEVQANTFSVAVLSVPENQILAFSSEATQQVIFWNPADGGRKVFYFCKKESSQNICHVIGNGSYTDQDVQAAAKYAYNQGKSAKRRGNIGLLIAASFGVASFFTPPGLNIAFVIPGMGALAGGIQTRAEGAHTIESSQILQSQNFKTNLPLEYIANLMGQSLMQVAPLFVSK